MQRLVSKQNELKNIAHRPVSRRERREEKHCDETHSEESWLPHRFDLPKFEIHGLPLFWLREDTSQWRDPPWSSGLRLKITPKETVFKSRRKLRL